jgi:[acyl-carrier-protein] S-malonyltransferase
MDDALGRVPPQPFCLPLYPNVTAAACTDPEAERLLLVEQVTGRVRWRESVLAMRAAGVDHFVEFGGKVLGPMVSRTVEDVTVTSVVTMADIEALAKELA